MAVDQGDVVMPPEPGAFNRPRLLFHVAGTYKEGIGQMKQFGLLSHSPTLTPRVDIGTYYNGGEFLTFWYPQRGEVNHGREGSVQTPTAPVTPEIRADMLRN